MLLLYLIHLLPADQRFANLHSTMLLLYHKEVSIIGFSTLTFTFHYASTLSRGGVLRPDIQSQFTFHYASTLSDFPSCTFNSDFYIYIPLCFYFIQNRRSSTDVRFKFTFHYASTLSASRLFLLPPFGIIYIPLCFYFILWTLLRKAGFSTFTFHYASTLSNSEYDIPHRIAKFTFHYASTLSRHIISSFDEILHLHSTMLLLYPSGFVTVAADQNLFTFHYASTLSTNLSASGLQDSIFTFHYASTLSETWKSGLQPITIYIPLCFYFIEVPGW